MKSWLVILAVSLFALFSYYCSEPNKLETQTYLNLHDSVQYVGKDVCMQCHTDIHQSFVETGMGKSFDLATPKKSAGDFSKMHVVHDKDLDLSYRPYFQGDSLFIYEFRITNGDTVHRRKQFIKYIVGSGHHTNSHLYEVNGYLFQAPITFYTQKGIWDLPPGFEQGFNSRFNRQIGLECMSCHNGYPEFVKGSENKFLKIPNGIDCERCHGPGSIHVREKREGILVDTSKYIDYSIVNPGKLSVDLQFDLCQRCHLQGNAVLKPGKSFYDFKPGMKLSDVMEVYLPRYENDESQFIMASHADRLKQSECFKVMAEKNGDPSGLRPYKNALTCVTCHNPHVSVRKAGSAVFNAKCNSCHSGAGKSVCSEKEMVRSSKENDCVSCHMPVSGSLDIPHVTVHDHYIRKRPVPVSSSPERGKFKGLASINSKSPDKLSQAKAYIQQFEKFDPDKLYMLDSAMVRLDEKDENTFRQFFYLYVHLYFAKRNYGKVAELTKRYGEVMLINKDLNKKSWDNQDAWTAYRIGESFSALGSAQQAFQFFKVAYRLAPYQFEFANKYGSSALMMNNLVEAERVFQKLTEEIPVYAPGWTNLGYVRLLNGDDQTAEKCYKKALSLNPDYTQASVNLAGLYVYKGNVGLARTVLLGVLKREPNNQEIKDILKKIPSR